MLKKICITALLLALNLNTAFAKNSAGENFYAKLNLGHQIQRVGYIGGISLGYFLSDVISIDTSGLLILHKFNIINTNEETNGNSFKKVITTGTGSNNIFSGLINTYYHFDIDSSIYPYITFGGGISSVNTNINKKWQVQTVTTKYIETSTSAYTNIHTRTSTKDLELQTQNRKYFAYQAGIGMRFNTDDNYSFDAGYRLMNIQSGKIQNIDFKEKQKYMHTIIIGTSIHF